MTRTLPGVAAHPFLGGYADALGFELVETSGERAVATWASDGPAGLAVFAAAAETVASVGASLWWQPRGRCVGMSNSTTAFQESATGPFTAVAEPVDRGRVQQLWRVDVTDGDGVPCAAGEVLMANLNQPEAI